MKWGCPSSRVQMRRAPSVVPACITLVVVAAARGAGSGRPTTSSNCHRPAISDPLAAVRSRRRTPVRSPGPRGRSRRRSRARRAARCAHGSQSAGVAGARRARHRGWNRTVARWRCRACWRAIGTASRSWRLRPAPTRGSPRLPPGWRLPKCGLRASRSGSRSMARKSLEAARSPICTRQSSRLMSICWCCRRPPTACAASAHLLKVDREARLAILAGDAGDEVEAAARRIIDSQLETVGTEVAVVAWRSSARPRTGPSPARTDRAAARRRHHGARRFRSRPGVVAGRPRRHRLDSPPAPLRQSDLRDLPGLLGRRVADPARRDAHAAGRRRARALPPGRRFEAHRDGLLAKRRDRTRPRAGAADRWADDR